MSSRTLTTADVARYCCVSQLTVSNWVKEGRLSAYKAAGGHDLIPLAGLRAFLERYQMPIDETFFADEGSRKRVLVVDDEAEAIEFMVHSLCKDGPALEIASASDGHDAMCQVTSFHPDLIILDLTISGLNGREVCHQLKRNPAFQHIKVLVIADGATSEQLAPILEAGADEVVRKPLDPSTLRKKAYALLGVSGIRAP